MTQSSQGWRRCPQCGAIGADAAPQCQGCGRTFTQPPPPRSAPALLLAGGAVALACVGLVFGIAAWVRGYTAGPSAPAPTPAAQGDSHAAAAHNSQPPAPRMQSAGPTGQSGAPPIWQPAPAVPQTPTPSPSPSLPPRPNYQGQPQDGSTVGMPQSVSAYLTWLIGIDRRRSAVEREAESSVAQIQPTLMTGGMGTDATPAHQPNPPAQPAAAYRRWMQKLADVQLQFRAGAPAVPAECRALQAMYGQALSSQASEAAAVASAMEARDMNRITQQMQVSRSIQETLEAADNEFSRICKSYGIEPRYHIQVVPGTTQLP